MFLALETAKKEKKEEKKKSVFLIVSTNTWVLFPHSYAYSDALAFLSTESEFRIDSDFISLTQRQPVNSILEIL